MKFGPDKNSKFPNPNIEEVCFIKNVITRPNIIVGDYTYYDDKNVKNTLHIITNFMEINLL